MGALSLNGSFRTAIERRTLATRLHHLALVVRRGHRLQQPWPYLGPADQEQRTHGIERRLSVVSRDDRVGHIQSQGDQAREDQKSPGGLQLDSYNTSQGQMSDAE